MFNVTGHPVVSVPAGLTPDGLPVGMQFVGSRYAEADLLAVAAAFERVNPGDSPDQSSSTRVMAGSSESSFASSVGGSYR